MRTFYITAFIITCSLAATAQTLSFQQDTLVWTVNQFTDSHANHNETLNCKFITYPSGDISWDQKDGEYVTQFDHDSHSGSWNNVSTDGTRSIHVSTSGKQGIITFTRSGNTITITFSFPENGQNTLPYSFNVTVVTRQPQ